MRHLSIAFCSIRSSSRPYRLANRVSFWAAWATLALAVTSTVRAQDDPIKPAPSKITQVTVYSNTALVTREVTAPEGAGLTELVVSPLPPYTLQSSLYAEGNDAIRVLSVRFRTRAIAEDTREEVRKLDTQLKTLAAKSQTLESDQKAIGENLKLLDKLENFTAKAVEHMSDKGQFDTEKIIALTKFVQDDRTKRTKDQLTVKQQLEDVQSQIAFTKRLLEEKSAGSVRTERDAVIVVDKKAGAGTVRFNYLVSNASWRPQYKFRTSGKEKDPVTVEYQAAVEQKTGEDWTNAQITLSTAQPLLNASPPDLKSLAVAVGPPGTGIAILPGDPRLTGQPAGGPVPGPGAAVCPTPPLSRKTWRRCRRTSAGRRRGITPRTNSRSPTNKRMTPPPSNSSATCSLAAKTCPGPIAPSSTMGPASTIHSKTGSPSSAATTSRWSRSRAWT